MLQLSGVAGNMLTILDTEDWVSEVIDCNTLIDKMVKYNIKVTGVSLNPLELRIFSVYHTATALRYKIISGINIIISSRGFLTRIDGTGIPLVLEADKFCSGLSSILVVIDTPSLTLRVRTDFVLHSILDCSIPVVLDIEGMPVSFVEKCIKHNCFGHTLFIRGYSSYRLSLFYIMLSKYIFEGNFYECAHIEFNSMPVEVLNTYLLDGINDLLIHFPDFKVHYRKLKSGGTDSSFGYDIIEKLFVDLRLSWVRHDLTSNKLWIMPALRLVACLQLFKDCNFSNYEGLPFSDINGFEDFVRDSLQSLV